MPKKPNKKKAKLTGNDKVVDLLERFSVANLYTNSELGQNDIAKILAMDSHRVNDILKGVKKRK